jgi:DNA-binding CsgD family transcriptional regulator
MVAERERPLFERSAPVPGQTAPQGAGYDDRWFSQLFGQTSDAVFVVGADFRVLWWGPQAEAAMGVPAGQAIGQRCFDLLMGRHGDGQARCGPGCWVMRTARRGRPVPAFQVQVQAADGQRRIYSLGVMRDQASTFLVHLMRPTELAEPPSDEPAEPPRPCATPVSNPLTWLTDRERQVLRLIVTGATSQEIGERLSISHATARNHVQNVLMKLGVHSRLEAALVAVNAGMEPPGGTPPTPASESPRTGGDVTPAQ